MYNLKRIYARICNRRSQSGFSILETVIALSVASISILGAYGLTLALEKNYRDSNELATMHGESRITMERMFKDLSETSNKTVSYTWNAISFASPRGANGEFCLKPYSSVLMSHRPSWQKAIIYYLIEQTDGGNKLYRAEVPKTDWASNYEELSEQALAQLNGEFIAADVLSMTFDYSPAVSLDKAHILKVSLDFGSELAGTAEGADELPLVHLTTRVPLMNRTR